MDATRDLPISAWLKWRAKGSGLMPCQEGGWISDWIGMCAAAWHDEEHHGGIGLVA